MDGSNKGMNGFNVIKHGSVDLRTEGRNDTLREYSTL